MKRLKIHKKKIIIFCVIVFCIYNIIWYVGKLHWYLQDEIKLWNYNGHFKITDNVQDDEKYCYYVDLPIYLYWGNGNLAISEYMEAEGDLFVSKSGLIIWREPFQKDAMEIGITLVHDNQEEQIYMIDNCTAMYSEQQKYIDDSQEQVDLLFHKAEKMWGIKMPWHNSSK